MMTNTNTNTTKHNKTPNININTHTHTHTHTHTQPNTTHKLFLPFTHTAVLRFLFPLLSVPTPLSYPFPHIPNSPSFRPACVASSSSYSAPFRPLLESPPISSNHPQARLFPASAALRLAPFSPLSTV